MECVAERRSSLHGEFIAEGVADSIHILRYYSPYRMGMRTLCHKFNKSRRAIEQYVMIVLLHLLNDSTHDLLIIPS